MVQFSGGPLDCKLDTFSPEKLLRVETIGVLNDGDQIEMILIVIHSSCF